MNNEPEKFTPKDYDSPKARHCEMLLSVEMDMTFIQGCCERILQDKKVELGEGKPRIGEDPTYTRALWDAAIVALFKHGGEGSHKRVKLIYRTVIASGGEQGKLLFKEWRNERNKRISHSVGHGELHAIGIALPPAPEKPDIVVFQSQKVSAGDKDATLLLDLAKTIRKTVNTELDSAIAELREEVCALPDKKLQALPDLNIQPGNRSNQPPGR
jgi:hypothetical protein